MLNHYFTHDCKTCPFWDAGRCTIINECSTVQDLYGENAFYGTYELVKYFAVNDKFPFDLSEAHFVDIDGIFVDNLPSDGFDVVLRMVKSSEIVGVVVPKSDK